MNVGALPLFCNLLGQSYSGPMKMWTYSLLSLLLLASCATTGTSSGQKSRSAAKKSVTKAAGKSSPLESGLPKTGPCAQFRDLILEASKQHGLEPELVMGVIQVESGYNPEVRSRVGATGLMQVMPRTAEHMACDDDLTDPETNIECGCRVLKKYLDLYNGNLVYGLSAYNCGPGNTNPSREESKTPFNFSYVEKVLRWRNVFVRVGCN